jgi:hypothetical protein
MAASARLGGYQLRSKLVTLAQLKNRRLGCHDSCRSVGQLGLSATRAHRRRLRPARETSGQRKPDASASHHALISCHRDRSVFEGRFSAAALSLSVLTWNPVHLVSSATRSSFVAAASRLWHVASRLWIIILSGHRNFSL